MQEIKALSVGLFGIVSFIAILHTIGSIGYAVFPSQNHGAPAFLFGLWLVLMGSVIFGFVWFIGMGVLDATGHYDEDSNYEDSTRI